MSLSLGRVCEAASPTTRFDAKTVAALTSEQIEAMTDVELVAVVQVVGDRFRPLNGTDNMDRQTLITLALLARRCCQGKSLTCR